MARYYFDQNKEMCYTLDYWLEHMRHCDIAELKAFEAIPEYGSGFFFCSYYGTIGEVGEGCGKICKAYLPRNRKNGRCRYSNYTYSAGKEVTLKTNQL